MIELAGVAKSFGSKHPLRGVSLSVEPGHTHVIIGRSGEGKSVTLKIVSGLLAPDRGTVRVAGREIRPGNRDDRRHLRANVNMLFQGGALFDSLTVAQNIAFPLAERRLAPRRQIERKVAELLEIVGLADTGHLYPSDLSGGMVKRVALARALIPEPEILLYDEPTSGLDPVTSDLINELIIATRERLGVTAIVVTHDMSSAWRVGDEISMLSDGEFIAQGPPESIRSHPDPRVQQFILGEANGPLTKRPVPHEVTP